ncbi:MAG: SDR family NAD(P)-dependent oxidoreductase [Gemmatimonadota bacterium]
MRAMGEDHGLHAGRTVIVAGGTGNVGRVLVGRFLDAGATVVVPSRSAGKLEDLRADIDADVADRLITIEGDIGDEETAPKLVEAIVSRHGPIHAAVATLGRFVPVESVLEASASQLEQVVDGYLVGHFVAARALIPAIEAEGSYTLINGPLAFRPMFARASLVSTVTAAQAMLARLLMDQVERVRVNEVVLYTPFGWSDDDAMRAPVAQEDVAAYVSLLASERGASVRGETIHLDSPRSLEDLQAAR